MNKKEVRKQQKDRLAQFTTTEQKKIEDNLLVQKLFQQKELSSSNKIGLTISLPIEVDTSAIIARLWELGKEVYLAKIIPGAEHTMDFVKYDYQTKLSKSAFGVYEVDQENERINNDLDLIIVPGLAYDLSKNYRLGFGGGYYDRFLKKHPATHTISLANSKMIFNKAIWPIESFDIAVDQIITVN